MTTTAPPPPAADARPAAPAAGPVITGDPLADASRRRGLRRMRTIAVSLLVGAAVVYVVTLLLPGGQEGVLGLVNAAAEASMVGAIADWFAVTALFRHPLGLPIPHTALIPRKKDELGRSLQDFVGENFLQEDVIRERIATATISARMGTWLARPENAQRVVAEAAEIGAIALTKVRPDHVETIWRDALVPRFHEEPISPLLGGLLTEVLRDDLHHGLVDLALEELSGWLRANPDTVTEVLLERAPWWTPERLNDRVSSRIFREIVDWVDDIRADPQHRARLALDSMLAQLAVGLFDDPDTQARTEALKDRLLDHPQMLGSAVSLWEALRRVVTASLQDHQGALRRRALHEVDAFAARLAADPALRARLDGWVADAVVWAVARYGDELTAVITHTVERWDGREAAARIELQVGRDLQFIRINGTLVGGLVGLVIHGLSVVLT